jgi:hypothetical protein
MTARHDENAPEHFAVARAVDPSKHKQFRRGIRVNNPSHWAHIAAALEDLVPDSTLSPHASPVCGDHAQDRIATLQPRCSAIAVLVAERVGVG